MAEALSTSSGGLEVPLVPGISLGYVNVARHKHCGSLDCSPVSGYWYHPCEKPRTQIDLSGGIGTMGSLTKVQPFWPMPSVA